MTIQRIAGRDVVLMDRLHSPSQEDVQLFVRKLHAGFLSYGLYPPGHSMIVKRTKELHSHLQKIFQEASLLVITCEQTLALNRVRILRNVPEREQAMKDASYLGLRGIKNITLWPGVQHDELGELLEIWHSINEEVEEEAFDWIHRFRSPSVRLNMDLIDSMDLEAAAHGGSGKLPIAISKQELAEVLSQLGPNAGASMSQDRGEGGASRGSTSVHLMDSDSASGASGASGSSMYGAPREASPDSQPVVHAQHVTQHVGGQVVQAQQVYQGGASPLGSGHVAGAGGPGPSSMPGVQPGASGYPAGGGQGGGFASSGEAPFSSDYPATPTDTRLPPGLREPAAYHPARQRQEAGGRSSEEESSSPFVPASGTAPPPGSDGETVVQRRPGMGVIGDLMRELQESKDADASTSQAHPHAQVGENFRLAEVTPSAADLPEIQGYLLPDGSPGAAPDSSPLGTPSALAPGTPLAGPYAGSPSSLEQDPSASYGGFAPAPSWPGSPGVDDSSVSYGGFAPGGPLPSPGDSEGTAVERNPMMTPPASPGSPVSPVSAPVSPVSAPVSPGVASVRPSQQWVSADANSLDQSNIAIGQLDFGKIEPCSLFPSRRFQEFLLEGGVGVFLGRYLSAAMGGYGGQGALTMVEDEGGWLRTVEGKALMRAVDQVTHHGLQGQLITSLAETVSSDDVELVDEQLAQLGRSASERRLRQEVLRRMSMPQRFALRDRVLERLSQAGHPDTLDGHLITLSMLGEDRLEAEGWRLLVPVLERVAERRADGNEHPAMRDKWEEWSEALASPSVGRVFFQQFLHQEEPALQAEAERGILSMGAASAYNLSLFLELANGAEDEARLLALARKVGQCLDDVARALFFDQLWEAGMALSPERHARLCQIIYEVRPDFVEKQLADRLDALEEREGQGIPTSEWVRWVQLALACHTPRLRQYLGRYLQERKFLAFPQVEGPILRLLDSHGTLQGFSFVERIIHQSHHPLDWKVSAVGLLGTLRTEESLLLLRRILLERRRFLRQPIYARELRNKALETLQAFPWRQIMELVKKVCQDSDEALRQRAQQMLQEATAPRPSSV